MDSIISQIPGILEIDHKRGVIYFHSSDETYGLVTVLRICRLPKPIPELTSDIMLDITHMYGTNWG